MEKLQSCSMNEILKYGLRVFLCCCMLLCGLTAYATHQRAGEISYTYVSGLTYEFTVTTYTYTPSPADRPEIEVSWGDGTTSIIARTQKVNLPNDISRNIYVCQHTFSASGTFHVTFEDPNRNAGIVNIPSSVEVPFFIETIIVINPFVGGNSSPQLLTPPIDNGCTNVTYYHNPGAFDADGDSLSYSLIDCRGYNGEDIPGYQLPNASNFIRIDSITGELVWDSPTMAGEYNIAILIQEWRNGMLISSMVRDMQITIAPCNNQPPVILVPDTCILAGTSLDLEVHVYDNTSVNVTLTATGEPLYVADSPAQFMPITDSVDYMTHFVWNTNCSHVKKLPYEVLFKAQDDGPQVELVSFNTSHIQVVAPQPENLQAVAAGNVVNLQWSPDVCSNAVGYDVYRRSGSNPFVPDYCETGMPEDEGYQWIGSTSAWEDTLFTDDGTILPLYHANEYCYRVVALFSDGAESYVSDEACVHIANDAPLIINADVVTTDSLYGTVKVRWICPPEIDSSNFLPPYFYDLYGKSSANDDWTLLNQNPMAVNQDTVEYLDHDLNTQQLAYSYKVHFFNQDTLIEVSDPATTIFLQANPADRRVALTWSVQQPWNNILYTIFRRSDSEPQWDAVGVTTETRYEDVALSNSETYCYYVSATGYYWLPDTIGPLYNRSQQVCVIPHDNQPPEVPTAEVTTDCQYVNFEWTFSSDSAAMDAYYYYIYYKPTLNGSYVCIDSFYRDGNSCYPEPCTYSISASDVLVGCFAMAVADTNHNLSPMTDSVCIDIFDCLDYHLPNVFTPNGDGSNDLFQPFEPYHGVVKVDMIIFDRWGRRVFHTEDPAILWDGCDENSHQPCSDGVFYYSCEIFVNTLSGQVSYPMHGSVTLIK
ncbi:MAG: gliding motility-associated C-terminal domain-containing protein [Bacteroidales bacterium]|nr:gliding motility-associated C-terminal domain-containing protein [Bacteroidales bacterium]